MTETAIRMLEVRGTHRQVGQQIGEACRLSLQEIVAQARKEPGPGADWEAVLRKASLFLEATRPVYPQYVEELEGIAEGAALPFLDVFAASCEELWEQALWRGCTDFAARGPATTDGSTLLAHTNDLDATLEEHLVILKVRAGDEPEFLAVSPGGLGLSAGFNAAGIALTGNEVTANDVRPGVPRTMVVRAILAARRLGQALDACLFPQRASSYNNIVADAWGEVYAMEGSATDCEPIYIEDNILAHANHYVSPPMRRFEAAPGEMGDSIVRHNRAMRLLRENYGQLSVERFQKLLADHANYPLSICKHGYESVTVFSIIIDLNRLCAWIGRGRPCQTTYLPYYLQPWAPPADSPG